MALATFTDKKVTRKKAITGGLIGLAALALPGQVRAQAKKKPDDSFVVLLKGIYQPVVHGPNLGLSTVDLNDGSYVTVPIYPVQGTPGGKDPNKPIGDFYGPGGNGDLCAYHIPGGSFAMRFTGGGDGVPVDDGAGGSIWHTTWELEVIEGTGIYRSLVGGHNHMVDKLHFLASGDVDEYCFCFITGP